MFAAAFEELFCRPANHLGGDRLHTQVSAPVADGLSAGGAWHVANNLNLILVSGIGPGRIVRPEKSHDLTLHSYTDMPRPRIIGYDQIRNREKGFELPKRKRPVSEGDQFVSAHVADFFGNLSLGGFGGYGCDDGCVIVGNKPIRRLGKPVIGPALAWTKGSAGYEDDDRPLGVGNFRQY